MFDHDRGASSEPLTPNLTPVEPSPAADGRAGHDPPTTFAAGADRPPRPRPDARGGARRGAAAIVAAAVAVRGRSRPAVRRRSSLARSAAGCRPRPGAGAPAGVTTASGTSGHRHPRRT